jgi:hypothetical protein
MVSRSRVLFKYFLLIKSINKKIKAFKLGIEKLSKYKYGVIIAKITNWLLNIFKVYLLKKLNNILI